MTVVTIFDFVVASLLTLSRLAVTVSLPLLLWLETVVAVVAFVLVVALVATVVAWVIASVVVVVAGVSTLTYVPLTQPLMELLTLM